MQSLENIRNKYKTLRLVAVADTLDSLLVKAEENEISYLEFAESIAEEELIKRSEKRIHSNMRRSGFPIVKLLEEFDYKFQSTINKRQISGLLDFSFIDNRENLIFIGPPGVGKTHLSIGLGIKAVESGY